MSSAGHAHRDPLKAIVDRWLVGYTNGLPYHYGKWRVARAVIALAGLESYYASRSFLVRRRDVRWELHPQCIVQRSVYLWGVWEPNDTREFTKLLSSGATVWDVGAYFGYYSLVTSAATKGTAHVVAFEPYPPNYRLLARNLSLNAFPRSQAVNVAVSSRSGTMHFRVPPDSNRGSGGLTEDPASGIAVPTTTLDAFAATSGTTRVDVIKIDAEGSEVNVLAGARELIAASRPAMMVEVDPGKLRKFGHTPADLLRELRNLGYELWSPTRQGLSRVEVGELQPDGFENLICLPRVARATVAAATSQA